MDRPKTAPDERNLPSGVAMVPGSLTSCALITVLTVLLAIYSSDPRLDPVLRTLYFAALFAAFRGIRSREPILGTKAYHLLEYGFLVLTLGFSSFTLIRWSGWEEQSRFFFLLSQCFEKGAVYLLGVSLITYGILLFLPSLVDSHRLLRERVVAVEDSNQQMESRMVDVDRFQAVGELAASVAHDLRNPLTIVKTAAESLARKSRRPEEVAEHSRVIARNIEKAERTIAGLLDLGKPRSMSLRTVDIEDIITEVVALVRPEAQRRSIQIVRTTTDAQTRTDPKQLTHVLINLLLNALQASPPHKSVRVRVRGISSDDGDWVAVAIEDRGIGLADGDRSKLFTPFFTTKETGTGLGLLSCRRILSDLGGSIQLYPRHRGGARALVLIPAQPAPVLA